MTRREALTDLLAKVEADDVSQRHVDALFANVGGFPESAWLGIPRIMGGSLDAAKALHEAVLPGWVWRIPAREWEGSLSAAVTGTEMECDDDVCGFPDYIGISSDPARAWLIAILKALIAQEPDA